MGGSLVGGFFVGESFFIVFYLVGALHGQACFMAQKKFAACKNDDVPQHVVWDMF